ncbi:MAG: PSD1 and planctomycete cytochrome C domain-containing protein [Chthoniobacter sp.]|uniref:PSD1 and planctomycete cytochrome C domain-containing protein n=1 Tax=Chthoniobacter sp. TaxID=2510640 RepID=UPI0032A3D210
MIANLTRPLLLRRRSIAAGLMLFSWRLLANNAVSAEKVDFVHDVYPILQRSCFECHGAEKHKGGLRLDDREAAFQGGDGGDTIVKGQPEKSELVNRISLPKEDRDVMPNRGEKLTKLEVERIRAWIAAGAPWPDGVKPARHWAYVPPVRPAVPPLPDAPRSPIDAFVRTRLSEEKLQPSPPAEPHVLARRLSLDLTGLPPTPAEVDAFTHAAKTNLQSAVEKLADHLLASPQFGEKWGRQWLDVARYADSHGFQRDDLVDLWPYRDWVIRAFNADMPFDQFTIEQLAGDLLPNATEQQRIATGFNRCTMCNVEAGTDPEENRVNQVIDRVNTMGMAWLGTTLECMQCHDHKYDPFKQRDYYGLFAFFNGTELEADRSNPKVPGSIRFLGPYMRVSDPAAEAKLQQVNKEIAATKSQIAGRSAKIAGAGTPAGHIAEAQEHVLTPTDFDSAGGANHRVLDDGSVLLLGDPPGTDTYTVTVRTPLQNIVGFKLEALTDPALPGMGPGRGDPERTNFVLHTFAVTAAPPGHEGEAKPMKLTDARADFSQASWDVSGAIDENGKTGWAIAPQFHRPHWATFRASEPLANEHGTVLTFRLVQEFGNARTIGRFRLSALTGAYPAAVVPPKDDPELRRLNTHLAELEKQQKTAPAPQTLVMKEITETRTNAIFRRGDFRNPGDAVEPGTPAVLHPLHEEGPRNRLALARWLVSRENPLVARVIVNRLWAEIFGEGIVSTPEDFGMKGERPSHPELLDWLAVEFMDRGWSQKKLLRLIVTSETYRQSSHVTPELLERDPLNRLLARGPRFRLGAEEVRDNALAVSGLLNLKQFGPPIHPPQPDGLWAKVGGQQYDYVVSPGDEQYRRGVYVVLKRASPYPSFTNFDATSRPACRVKRTRSNTPLQALTLLNDPVYVQAAHGFAARIVHEQPSADVDGRINYAFRLALARPPAPAELSTLHQLYDSELAATGKPEEAWFSVASALLNVDEAITKD